MPIVQIKLIGGFGNQLHQYAAARKYAELVGARLEIPAGSQIQTVFGLEDPSWSRDLPEVNDGAAGSGPTVEWGQVDVRLGGYFQTQEWVGRLSRRELKQWLVVRKTLVEQIEIPTKTDYVAAHLRRGDYVNHPLYCTVSKASYVAAADKLGLRIDEWAVQEQPRRAPAGLEFLGDWLMLARAGVLFRANSTFSWWAGALGDGDVHAPVVEDRVGEHDVAFARGNWPRCADVNRVGVRVDDLHLSE